MHLLVQLGPWDESQYVVVEGSPAELLVSELLEIVIDQMPPTLSKMIRSSRAQGAHVFFSTTSKGPERLVESLKVSDYKIADGSTLWLMWSHAADAAKLN